MRGFAGVVLLVLLAAACGDSSGPQTDESFRFTDPQGDTVAVVNPTVRATDAIATEVTVLADVILLRLEFAAPVTPWSQGQPNPLDGFLDLDLDENSATGVPGAANEHGGDAQMGADWYLDLRDDGAEGLVLIKPNSSDRIGATIQYLGTAVEIRLPRAALGETDGRFLVAFVLETEDRPVSDFVPNVGHYAIAPR